jgi:GPN-loop GTPase
MLNLTRVVDRATGYVFVPQAGTRLPEGAVADTSAASSAQPNAYALMSSAMGPRVGARSDVRDVQERWVDARDEWDAYENAQWRREGEALRQAAAEVEKQKKLNIRERK